MTIENGPKGLFEKFKSDWLLQVAADRRVKSAAPVAIALCCGHLNRKSGRAWPSNATLMKEIGAEAENTIRTALKLLEEHGHANIIWTRGGSKKTNIVMPLVAGEPLNNLKGSKSNIPSNSSTETLQLSDPEPLKKLKGNHLREPPDQPSERAHGPSRANAPNIDKMTTTRSAPSVAPVGASGADEFDDDDDFFLTREFEQFGEEEDPSEFVRDGNPDLPIRANPDDWRRLLKWIGDIHGQTALKQSAAARRAGTLTIAMIETFTKGVADVA